MKFSEKGNDKNVVYYPTKRSMGKKVFDIVTNACYVLLVVALVVVARNGPLVVTVYAEAAAAFQSVVAEIRGMLPLLGGLLIGLGVVTIAVGVASDSPSDKQKGGMAVAGGALITAAGSFFG